MGQTLMHTDEAIVVFSAQYTCVKRFKPNNQKMGGVAYNCPCISFPESTG